MDLDAEIAKCDKKLTLARLNLEKIMKIVSQQDYAETVPSAVQMVNDEKVGLSVSTTNACSHTVFDNHRGRHTRRNV